MKQIYIVISQTGTLFSRALRHYTKDPFNHASLSFDSNLTTMYSFGRKTRYNFLNSGFVYENFEKGLYQYFPDAKCRVLEVSVSEEAYESMIMAMGDFCNEQAKYRYNIVGILGFAAGVKIERKYHYFCSQFVSHILTQADLWDKTPEFTKPMDFYALENYRIVYDGQIKNFHKMQLDVCPI